MSINKHSVTAVILAGGKGSRLGGSDKGLLKLNNLPLVEHLINRIKPQVSQIIMSANRNIERYVTLGFPVYKDVINDFAGPLAGILTALKKCQTEWLITVPADSPFIPADIVLRLSQDVQDNKIIMVHDGERLQPTFALIHTSLSASLENFLSQGERKTRVWMQQQTHKIVDFSDNKDAFMNINTENDLKNAETIFKNT